MELAHLKTVTAMIKVKLFSGREKNLVAYNGQALLNFGFEFMLEVCDNTLDITEEPYDFSDFVSGYFHVFNERTGRRVKNIPTDAPSGAAIIINSNDMLFEDLGDYYYEMGYLQTGGYEIVLMYGILTVV